VNWASSLMLSTTIVGIKPAPNLGPALNPDMVRLQNFLARNGYPHQVLDPSADLSSKDFLAGGWRTS
jgi:hypothetical protein